MKTTACRTYSSWTRKVRDGEGRMLTVSMVKRWDPLTMLDFGYICSCGCTQPCVHVALVKGEHCGWCAAYDPEEPTRAGRCPRCGDETQEIEVPDP